MRRLTRLCVLLFLLAVADAPHRAAQPAKGISSNATWLAAVESEIARAEYNVSGAEPQAPNRANGLRTYFEPAGVRVVPRTQEVPSWTWKLALADYGRETALRAPCRAARSARANRVEYRRGDLVEWYVNDERGLEQGFTL